jgi:DNA mismatch repair protein MutS
MNIFSDQQTLDDLNITGKYKPGSLFSLYNKVRTPGGERLLQQMFLHPLTEPDAINRRSYIFRYFQERNLFFPFDTAQLAAADTYLGGSGSGGLLLTLVAFVRNQVLAAALRDERHRLIVDGIRATIDVLKTLREYVTQLSGSPLGESLATTKSILADQRLAKLDAITGEKRLFRHDHLLRTVLRQEIATLFNFIHELDVYTGVTETARERDLSYAVALPKEVDILQATALRHPGLSKGVGNSISLSRESNAIFLTGANMAGKSTFMKSIGAALYLAHMGFPVAALDMRFSVREGLYSSINVSDNLMQGYSHFYAEVLRVKTVARAVASGKNLFVLFDELFKGTNVKDAYDATLAVTNGFLHYKTSFFVISTHIIELGDPLRAVWPRLQLKYLPTVLEGSRPRYTYTLEDGITADRHGMMILQQEGILQLLE